MKWGLLLGMSDKYRLLTYIWISIKKNYFIFLKNNYFQRLIRDVLHVFKQEALDIFQRISVGG